ncbi:class I SAM-dependent methyltransferase [Streptomyces sp. NPDC005648]|uniref:class I SAM-dependent methyltransferase n=1 Tax=Streptomyces sp. NPDC005648 TaxID=3157044 RepID=UPI0033AF252B
MPTLPVPGSPSQQPSQHPSRHDPHRRRDVAESYGADAERYDRARPRYPETLVERIVDASPGPDFLDVGCGTGIVARQFRAAGRRVLGVEPDARMAGLARRLGVDVEETVFEEWEPGGREFDAVVAGTAWHWVDPVAGAARAARVLRPGGLLAVFWNVPQLPPELLEAIADSAERVLPDPLFDFRTLLTRPAATAYQTILDRAADGIRQTGAFGELQQWRHDWEFTYSRDAWLDVMPTQGAFTRLPTEHLARLLEAAGAAIDAQGGSFTATYATLTVAAKRPVRAAQAS